MRPLAVLVSLAVLGCTAAPAPAQVTSSTPQATSAGGHGTQDRRAGRPRDSTRTARPTAPHSAKPPLVSAAPPPPAFRPVRLDTAATESGVAHLELLIAGEAIVAALAVTVLMLVRRRNPRAPR